MTTWGLVGAEGFVLLGLIGLTVSAFVAAMHGWVRRQRARQRYPTVSANSVEATASYRRYLIAVAWSGGSAREWDVRVRPVLAELVELAVAERGAGGRAPREAARELLGPELWALADRNGGRARFPAAGARDALVRILDRLEAP